MNPPVNPAVAPGGVVIVAVGPGSALEDAGARPGDLLLAWERLPGPATVPPIGPSVSRGPLGSSYDWSALTAEQAPRGTLRLTGRRGGEPLVLEVAVGDWTAEVRPNLPADLLERWAAGGRSIAHGRTDRTGAAWQGAARDALDWRLASWIEMRIAAARMSAGDRQAATAALRSALERAPTTSSRARVLDAEARILEEHEDLPGAAAAWEAVLETLEASPGDDLRVADTHRSLGRVQGRLLADLEAAHDHLARALAIYEREAPASLERADVLNRLAWIAWDWAGDGREPLEYFREAAEIGRRVAPRSFVFASSLEGLGLASSGDPATARSYLQEALELRRELAPGGLEEAASWRRMGSWVFELKGDLGEAEAYLRRALGIRGRLAPDSLALARTLNDLGCMAYQRGQIDIAQGYLERALEIRRRLAPNGLHETQSLKGLAAVATFRGEFDLASEYLERAFAIEERVHSSTRHVTLSRLARAAIGRGRWQRARTYLARSLEAQQSLGDRISVSANLSDLGVVGLRLGDVQVARSYLQRAWDHLEAHERHTLVAAQILSRMGEVALRQGAFDVAEAKISEALGLFRRLAPDTLQVALCHSRLAAVARRHGALELAVEREGEAVATLDRQVARLGGAERVTMGFRSTHSDIYRAFIEGLLDLGRLGEAFDVLERSRAQSFLVQLARRDLVFESPTAKTLEEARQTLAIRYDRILQQMASLDSEDDGERVLELEHRLLRLQHEYDESKARILASSPDLAALHHPRSLDLAAARRALDPGTLMLSYEVGASASAVFAVTREGGLRVELLGVGEAWLRERTQTLLESIRGDQPPATRPLPGQQRFGSVAGELFDKLIGPVSDLVERSERLVVVPDGPLHRLPFAALVRRLGDSDGADEWQHLVEWRPIHTALSATVYAMLRSSRPAGAEDRAGGAPLQLVAFGDPQFPSTPTRLRERGAPGAAIVDPGVRSAVARGLLTWGRLPHTRTEVESIARLFPSGSAEIYLGNDATEERAKSLDRRIRIRHFATHSYTDEEFPLNSALVLSIPPGFQEGHDNGLLQVWEILESVRMDADLVVLSACETGLGQDVRGEGLIGLTRAFHHAGARSVLSSLWRVSDRQTAELMVRFYRHLRRGETKDRALQSAQLELLRAPIRVAGSRGAEVSMDASAPYFWAGFELHGDWR